MCENPLATAVVRRCVGYARTKSHLCFKVLERASGVELGGGGLGGRAASAQDEQKAGGKRASQSDTSTRRVISASYARRQRQAFVRRRPHTIPRPTRASDRTGRKSLPIPTAYATNRNVLTCKESRK